MHLYVLIHNVKYICKIIKYVFQSRTALCNITRYERKCHLHEEDVSRRLCWGVPQEARVVVLPAAIGVGHRVVSIRAGHQARAARQFARPRAHGNDVINRSRLDESTAPNLARSDAHCRCK